MNKFVISIVIIFLFLTICPFYVFAAGYWKPKIGDSIDWQLSKKSNIIDVDMFDTSSSTIKNLHNKNKKVICYINVGAYEEWRADKKYFPKKILGKKYIGWPGEYWLDIRQTKSIMQILEKRFDLAKSKGCDAIDVDNVDGYLNKTGFNITSKDQLKYNLLLVDLAHQRGMSIGLKNNQNQVNDLVDSYDFAIIESCFSQGWCQKFLPFVKAGKPVFEIEYVNSGINFKKMCEQAKNNKFYAIMKNKNLDSYYKLCF